ncbi:helix-turn-helix domain-containing protein [Phreatobacter stygius]|uniref:helix-turn-helix domain-containing protein n=1 Tax=Phreatobacter stygius TaxID=1940610 RepID=UPI0014770FAC|nr:XRE family transcriptional regulator [Phreatobacter stygius]
MRNLALRARWVSLENLLSIFDELHGRQFLLTPTQSKEKLPNMKMQDDALLGLGARIRALREERGMKLKELADGAGLSDAFVSRLERGQVSSSVANLIQIAQVLEIGVGELFAAAPDQLRSDVTVHRIGDAGEAQAIPATGYRWSLFAGGMPNDDLEVFHLVFPRKNRMDLMVSHPGQEYCYVISGRIQFHVGAESFDLAPGEGIFLNSELPHRADNIGDDEARVLMVVAKSPLKTEHFDWWRVPTASQSMRQSKTKSG